MPMSRRQLLLGTAATALLAGLPGPRLTFGVDGLDIGGGDFTLEYWAWRSPLGGIVLGEFTIRRTDPDLANRVGEVGTESRGEGGWTHVAIRRAEPGPVRVYKDEVSS